jgi:phosphoribosylamine--glycine ligase
VNVLILGSGGREHALAWAIAKSSACGRLVCAPGNAGTARLAENAVLDPSRGDEVVSYCRREDIDLVVVGPEAPLVAGLADHLRREGALVFGAGREAARLEGSKVHAKKWMRDCGVPTARAITVGSRDEAARALEELGERVAVKADGLAAGKGVVMAENRDAALDAVRRAVEEKVFGEAGSRLVLEEWLEGDEASVMAVVAGDEIRTLVPSQDHKRVYDGDRGPNTGGMGAYAPYPPLGGKALEAAVASAVTPIVEGLARQGIDFRGVLYAGLMFTSQGLKVLEYNVRFGDPEAQVVLPLLDGDALELFAACARGNLASAPPPRTRPGAALTVVAASAGYPRRSDPGRTITGLEEEDQRDDAIVFHAGTARREDGRIVTAGGRVLAVTGLGPTLAAAREAAHRTLATIRFEGMFHRTDIGEKGLAETATVNEETG